MWENASIFVTFPLRGGTDRPLMLGIVWMRMITCQGSGLVRMVSPIGDLGCELTAELGHPRALVDELRRLDTDGRESPGQLRGNSGKCLVQVGPLLLTRQRAPAAPHAP